MSGEISYRRNQNDSLSKFIDHYKLPSAKFDDLKTFANILSKQILLRKRRMTTWISVDDFLPNADNVNVLVKGINLIDKSVNKFVAYIESRSDLTTNWAMKAEGEGMPDISFSEYFKVTHWTFLPD